MLYTWNHINRGRVWRGIYNFFTENQLTLRLEMVCGCTGIFVTCFIYLRGKQLVGFFFHYHCAVYDVCKKLGTLWHESRIRIFVHYTISLHVSSLCRFVWTYDMRASCILSSVCLRVSLFSHLPLSNMWKWEFSADPILIWWFWEYLYLTMITKLEI